MIDIKLQGRQMPAEIVFASKSMQNIFLRVRYHDRAQWTRQEAPMNPREKVLRVLHGQRVDRVPFTVYECMIPQCVAEREMRNRGLCIVNRSSVFAGHQPNVKFTSQTYCQGA